MRRPRQLTRQRHGCSQRTRADVTSSPPANRCGFAAPGGIRAAACSPRRRAGAAPRRPPAPARFDNPASIRRPAVRLGAAWLWQRGRAYGASGAATVALGRFAPSLSAPFSPHRAPCAPVGRVPPLRGGLRPETFAATESNRRRSRPTEGSATLPAPPLVAAMVSLRSPRRRAQSAPRRPLGRVADVSSLNAAATDYPDSSRWSNRLIRTSERAKRGETLTTPAFFSLAT